jgi:hypothetical protein
MKLQIKVSTIFIFIVTQTIISIFFYLGDSFISGVEAIIILLLSIPLTYFVEWLRGINLFSGKKDNQ